MRLIKKRYLLLLAIAVLSVGALSFGYVKAAYLTTNRDTKMPPDKVTYDIANVNEFEKIYETDAMVYYYREDRDVIAVHDKRNGYTWKTGLDIPFGADINEQVLGAATKEEAEKLAVPIEEGMNSTYTAISNSILTVEYYEAETVKNISSAAKDMVESQLVTLNDNPATRRLDVDFKNIEVKVQVYITLEEDSIHYEIKDEEITGKGVGSIMALNITPFLGASGGKLKYYNPETGLYDIVEDKYMVPGYIFVPDGSGGLMRFQDNNASFSMYVGDVYGADPAQDTYQLDFPSDVVPLKEPVMPVFGVAHGDRQAAFVAYADSGAEYMQITVRPEENLTAYNFVYPRFVKNTSYFQVYNKKGDGFFTIMKEPNHFNIEMTYRFLSGDGSEGTFAADYTGMALAYREHLIEEGILTKKPEDTSSEIPIRLDFIMSESKKGIVGTDEVVVTSAGDVGDILNKFADRTGITNINSGLIGWQQGGESFCRPNKPDYYRHIGSKKEFKDLITDFAKRDIDISYAREYTTINREMLGYYNNAVRHVNSWYLEQSKIYILPINSPVTVFGYATPFRSASWFTDNFKKFSPYSNSMTVSGISNVLTSNYGSDGVDMTVTDAIALYGKTFENADQKLKLNMEAPNQYLWKYTDRFLKCPVGNSQYVFETDSVPFLQMVLHGTMEVYAPYSNFSFYTQKDILCMIDYNLFPSFILSKEPSFYLASTISSDLYSTEYEQYEKLMKQVYSQVNGILSQVKGFDWIGREVLQNGVIKNIYQKGSMQKVVVINYTEESAVYEQNSIAPLSASAFTVKEVLSDEK